MSSSAHDVHLPQQPPPPLIFPVSRRRPLTASDRGPVTWQLAESTQQVNPVTRSIWRLGQLVGFTWLELVSLNRSGKINLISVKLNQLVKLV